MGEVERVRASLGASFGSDLQPRIVPLKDRQSKHQRPQDDHDQAKGDAVELHDESAVEVKLELPNLSLETGDHLDLSA